MAHSSIKPIWKYTWKPEGYGVETLELDTSASLIGAPLKLEHAYFRGREFAASADGAELSVGYEDKPLTGKEDLILQAYDVRLSQLGDSGIYRVATIASKRAKSKKLIVKVNYIADAIDPEELGQVLNATADVVHNSLTVKKLASDEAAIKTLTASQSLEGDWGSMTVDTCRFTAQGLRIEGVVELTPDTIDFDKKIPDISVGQKPFLKYDSELHVWETWSPRAEKFLPLMTSRTPIEELIPGSIPMIDSEDLTSLSYTDWFKLDLNKKSLKVPNLETESVSTEEGSIVLKGDSILWQGHSIRVLDDGTLDIDNLLQVNRAQGTVRVGGVIFDKKLLAALKKIGE